MTTPPPAARTPPLPRAPGGPYPKGEGGGALRLLGSGVITGAADDDASAIGTYASAGARFGFGFLWIAPLLLPMMIVVTYVAAKLGRVYGKGLFASVRDRYPRFVLYPLMILAFSGNIIEAAANLGGIGAAVNLLAPGVPIPAAVVAAAAVVIAFQLFGSYQLLRSIFQWLALILFAYVGAAILAKPDPMEVLRATVMPRVTFTPELMALLVGCIGTSLSAYIYTWQSNQEVEEQIAEGKTRWWQRRGASRRELGRTRRDVIAGMIFSNLILYFIVMATGATLHEQGITRIDTAADAARALEPLAGAAAKWLFAGGLIGVAFLALPIMTTGAAYDLVQGLGKPGDLHKQVGEAKLFYAVIGLATAAAAALLFLGLDPIKAMLLAGVVQGFTVPPLLFTMMLMTNDRRMMGEHANNWLTNLVGWATVAATSAATAGLVYSWL